MDGWLAPLCCVTGPAMIEGGGLGIFKPTDVGPLSIQVPNGVVDIVVKDEAEGVAVAKKYSTVPPPLSPRLRGASLCTEKRSTGLRRVHQTTVPTPPLRVCSKVGKGWWMDLRMDLQSGIGG